MTRRDLEDRIRKTLTLYTDAGPRMGQAMKEMLEIAEEYAGDRAVDTHGAGYIKGSLDTEEIHLRVASIKSDLEGARPREVNP